MLLWIAFGLAIIYLFVKPYGDGFLDSSMWLAKIIAPPEARDSAESKHLLKMIQASIMDGWPSNVPLLVTLLGLSCMILAIIYVWWMGLVMYIVIGGGAAITKRLISKPVTYYITLLYHRMTNRIADYIKINDSIRAVAATETKDDLEKILQIYFGTGIKVPSRKLIEANPYGDVYFVKNLYEG